MASCMASTGLVNASTGVAPTGGQAKLMIQGGDVQVNGTLETRRGRKLVSGDRVTVGGQTFDVDLSK